MRPSHSVRPKNRLTASGNDLISILRCFLSFKTVVTSRNIIVFKIQTSGPKNGHPSLARSLVPRASSCGVNEGAGWWLSCWNAKGWRLEPMLGTACVVQPKSIENCKQLVYCAFPLLSCQPRLGTRPDNLGKIHSVLLSWWTWTCMYTVTVHTFTYFHVHVHTSTWLYIFVFTWYKHVCTMFRRVCAVLPYPLAFQPEDSMTGAKLISRTQPEKHTGTVTKHWVCSNANTQCFVLRVTAAWLCWLWQQQSRLRSPSCCNLCGNSHASGILTTCHKRVQTYLYHVCTVYAPCYHTSTGRHGTYNYWITETSTYMVQTCLYIYIYIYIYMVRMWYVHSKV